MWFKLALRLFKRELSRGELTIIAIAITLAVLSVFSLSAISSRIQAAVLQKSASFIAADRVLQSARLVEDSFFAQAPLEGIEHGKQIIFSSMIFYNDELQMGDVKAVTESYPLRGELVFSKTPYGVQEKVNTIPKPGHVWLGRKMFDLLNVNIGDVLEVGMAKLKVSGVIVEEPDGSFSVFNAAPRVLMNYQDIPATQVIQPGSRITYRHLFAGEPDKIQGLTDWVKPQILDNQFWYGVKDRQSPVTSSLERAEQFLLLSGLLGVILAAVAIAVAAQRYCQRHYDPVAIFKTLGASSTQVRKIYVAHLILLTLMSVVAGLLLGYLIQSVIFQMISEYLPKPTPTLGLKPFVIAIATGVTCALMFSLYPLLQLFDIPPLRVLRRNAGDAVESNWRYLALSGLTVFLLMLAYSQSFLISAVMFGVGAVMVVVLLLLSRLFVNAGRAIGVRPSNPFHLAMASIKRRVRANSVQLITFTFAIHLLLSLFILKNDIIGEWQAQLPENAPNHFLANVTKDEMTQVNDFLTRMEIPSEGLYPVVRGVLSKIGDEKLIIFASKEEEDKSDGGGRQGIGRELNMTWHHKLPKDNELLEGKWFEPGATNEVSIESRVAERLEITLGTQLTFLVGTDEYTVTVSSIRKVDWNTMQPNFFMIFSEDVLQDFPATYIASFRVGADKKREFNQFLKAFPTIMVIEVDAIINQVQSVIEQVSLAVEFVLLIVIIAGVLVLTAQVQSSIEERQQEIVILRTLGAKGSLIRNSVMIEFLMLGVIAGVMATIATEGLLALLQSQVFSMQASIHWELWWMGPVIGGIFVSLVGLASTARLLTRNTSQMLRSVNL
ncbi:MAG: putative ABC transport system permease protein [Phenylobacterium sp.]|jgi:putative ABC transport system permease protein